jgi:hypothetical protein
MNKSTLIKLAAILFFLAGAISLFAHRTAPGVTWICLGVVFLAISMRKP